LGAEVITTADEDSVDAVLRVAFSRNITQIVVGKPDPPPWWRMFTCDPAISRLIGGSGDIGMHVAPVHRGMPVRPSRRSLAGIGLGTVCRRRGDCLDGGVGGLLVHAAGWSTAAGEIGCRSNIHEQARHMCHQGAFRGSAFEWAGLGIGKMTQGKTTQGTLHSANEHSTLQSL
jgi:hypothetical protein